MAVLLLKKMLKPAAVDYDLCSPAGLAQPQLRVSLYGLKADSTTYMTDGTLINYDDGYSNVCG